MGEGGKRFDSGRKPSGGRRFYKSNRSHASMDRTEKRGEKGVRVKGEGEAAGAHTKRSSSFRDLGNRKEGDTDVGRRCNRVPGIGTFGGRGGGGNGPKRRGKRTQGGERRKLILLVLLRGGGGEGQAGAKEGDGGEMDPTPLQDGPSMVIGKGTGRGSRKRGESAFRGGASSLV